MTNKSARPEGYRGNLPWFAKKVKKNKVRARLAKQARKRSRGK